MSDRPAIRVLEAIATTPWAMTEEYLQTMLAIADRAHDVSPEALEQMRSRRIADAAESLSLRDGVGVVGIRGPMFRYADFFSSISGATTYEGMALDLRKAADDGTIRSVLLNIDSPGGEVNGMQELAAQIRAIKKPVRAYVGGQGASAAYLLAAAANEIIVAPNAILGSIGVRLALRDTTARDERGGVRTYEFVSSQSPNKRLDPTTDAGRAQMQRVADDLAESFIKQVADYRGVTYDDAISQFGAGGVEIGARAVAVGLADRLGTFEETLAELARGSLSPQRPTPRGIPIMAEKTPAELAAEQRAHDAAVAAARTEGAEAAVAAFKARSTAIMALESAKGREAMARTFIDTTDLPADKVDALLKASPVAAPAPTPPATPAGRRASGQADGLVHTDEPETGKKPAPVKIDYTGLYDKFSGRPAVNH